MQQTPLEIKQQIQAYLKAGAKTPAHPERFYCFFGILTQEHSLPQQLPLISLAAVCTPAPRLESSQPEALAYLQAQSNEHTRLVQFMRCHPDYQNLIIQHHQQLDRYMPQHSGMLAQMRFFRLHFAASFGPLLVDVLAYQFHFRCMLLQQFYPHPVANRHQKVRLIKKTTRLLQAMAQDPVHGPQHIEQFWNTCNTLNQRIGLRTQLKFNMRDSNAQYAGLWLLIIALMMIFMMTCFWVFRVKG